MTPYRASAGFTPTWKHFTLDIADNVATITFSRPEKLGALTFGAYADLRDLLAELPHRGDTRVIVITGTNRVLMFGSVTDREAAGREVAAGRAAACWAIPSAGTVAEPPRAPGQAAWASRAVMRMRL